MKSLIETYSQKIYIIDGKSPAEIREMTIGQEWMEMPNGDMVKTANISEIMSYKSYRFQADQKGRHKKGQFIAHGHWNDRTGQVADAHLESITGEIKKISDMKKLL